MQAYGMQRISYFINNYICYRLKTDDFIKDTHAEAKLFHWKKKITKES